MARYAVLSHHGIKGQKWGIRRYQNADGTLTTAGKKRYYDSEGNEKKIYPIVTGERFGIGPVSMPTGNIFHKHGKTMTKKDADKYLQKSLDKERISDVYMDGKDEMVKLTDKGAKRFNTLARYPLRARIKGGQPLLSEYYIQMERGFSKDVKDRVGKSVGALAATGAIGAGLYAVNPTFRETVKFGASITKDLIKSHLKSNKK